MQQKRLNWKKHILIFLLTLIIFGGGFFLSNFLFEKRIVYFKDLQQDLTIDILSLETQFSLLTQVPCENLDEPGLTEQLQDISQKLSLIGNRLGEKNTDFLRFKKYYSILQIKYWLLLEKFLKRCDLDIVSMIYFYSNEENCPKCQDQSYILSYLKQKHPFLRIYSFDYDLSLSAIQALKSIFSLDKDLPIIIVNNKVYYGFKNKEDMEEILKEYIEPELFKDKQDNSKETTSTKEKN